MVPSFINTHNVDTGPKAENLASETVGEYGSISTGKIKGQENEYVYSRAGAKGKAIRIFTVQENIEINN